MTSTIASGSESPENENKKTLVALASSLNDRLDTQIGRADAKAQLILAACTFMAATIAPVAPRINSDIFSPLLSPVQRFGFISVVLVVVSLLACVYFALLVTRPALGTRKQKPSLLYFGHIIQLGEQEFVEKFMKQRPEDIPDAILSQVYQKARIAERKFAGIRRSLNFLFLTFVFWALTGVLLALAQ